MHDTGPPPGWWLASDGRWYPPEAWQGPGPVPAGAPAQPARPVAVATQERPADAIRYPEGWVQPGTSATPASRTPGPARTPAGPSGPGRGAVVVAIVAAVALVAAAGWLFIPRDDAPPRSADGTIESPTSGPTEPDEAVVDDPLTLDSVLSDVNVRPSDLGDGYSKAIDGAIDPLGGDGCAQPGRPFQLVAAQHWVAYDYSPNDLGLGGMPFGHAAGSVTVFDSEEEALKRAWAEHQAPYLECLERWATGVWFEGSGHTPVSTKLERIEMDLPGDSGVAQRYTAEVEIEGQLVPLYTDFVIFTVGRMRMWVELSSIQFPLEPANRDLLVGRLGDRVAETVAAYDG